MRIPDWKHELKPLPEDLVQAVIARRGGTLLKLDRGLLWSEPLARGWNTYLKAVRTELTASRTLREIGICTVALITGAQYEYKHHAVDYLSHGGTQKSLDALRAYVEEGDGALDGLNYDEGLVARYAAQMTRNVSVQEALFNEMALRFDTTEVVEITAAIATYNMVARFLVALNITDDD